jgi:hypothetical protein
MTDLQVLLVMALATLAFAGYLAVCDRVRG